MSNRIVSKTYGTVSTDKRKAMSGLEFVQGLVDGSLPLNTIAKTLGYDIIEAESGRVVITAEPNDTHLNPAGGVHGGLAATMLDSCMGLAVQSMLEKGIGQTTLEFKISFVRPIKPETGSDQGRRHCAEPRSPCGHRRRTRHGREECASDNFLRHSKPGVRHGNQDILTRRDLRAHCCVVITRPRRARRATTPKMLATTKSGRLVLAAAGA